MEVESNDEQAARVKGLWQTLDVDRRGLVDTAGLKRGLRQMDHPLQNAESFLDTVMAAVDSNKDGRIEYNG
jgi:solute carrier family 25 phosphate transporter 23/24/25/41